MSISGKSKRDQFLHQYAWDLPNYTGDGILIHVCESVTGRLVISIELGENTTARQLRDAEPLAMHWRDRLNTFQGGLFEQISVFKETLRLANTGKTYAEIARHFNKRISDLLYNSAKLQDTDAFSASIPRWDALYILANFYAGDYHKERRGRYRKGEQGHRWNWANDIIEDALGEIAKGKKPFYSTDSPLSGDNIKNALTQWRRKKRGAKT